LVRDRFSGPAVLDAVAAPVVHVGPIGAGNTAKPANQVVVTLNIAAVSDALVLAQKATLDPTTPTT
jgi:2-hydroxy-3-oxopropionate reductase